MGSVHQRTRSAPSPLVGEGWGGGGAYGNASASIAPPPPLAPPHKGEGNAPSARPHCASNANEHVLRAGAAVAGGGSATPVLAGRVPFFTLVGMREQDLDQRAHLRRERAFAPDQAGWRVGERRRQ